MRMTVASVSDASRRHLQRVERLATLFTRDGADAKRVQIVGKQHRRRFAQPDDAAIARDVFERHHENPRPARYRPPGRALGVAASTTGRTTAEHARCPLHEMLSADSGDAASADNGIFKAHRCSPVARQVTTVAIDGRLKSENSRVYIAA